MKLPSVNPRLRRVLAVACLLLVLLIMAAPAFAAGGGVGGGSSFGGGGGSGFGGGGGSFGGGYGGYGGGFGLSPWAFLPFLGFGGGGGLGIVLIIVFLMFGRSFFSGFSRGGGGGYGYAPARPNKVTLAQIDVALLGSAGSVPSELHRLVASTDTSTRQGYSELMQDAALLLLRNKQYWHSAAFTMGVVPYDQAESAYNQTTLAARSRLTFETLTNVSGRVRTGSAGGGVNAPDDSGGGWIVVTLIAASLEPFPKADQVTAESIEAYLRKLAGTPADSLEAAEVVWLPDENEQPLTRDDLLAKFPTLVPV